MLVVTIMLLMTIITSEIIISASDNDEDVIMMAIIRASDYEGSENEMAIQRITPAASAQLCPFRALAPRNIPNPSNDDLQKRCHPIYNTSRAGSNTHRERWR